MVRIPEHMKMVHAANSADVIHTIEDVDTKTKSIGRPKDNRKPNPNPLIYPTFDVSAVHHKSTESRRTQIRRHNVVQDDYLKKETHIWRDEVKLFDRYSAYRADFIEMLTDFQLIWNSPIGCICVSKELIEI